MKSPIKILIADDHLVVREGASMVLKRLFKEVMIFQAETISESRNLIKEKEIDLLILDAHFQEESSLEFIGQVKEIQPECKVLMFSVLDEEMYAMRFITAGADGYLNKLSSENETQEAVRMILETGKYISPVVKEKIVNSILYKQQGNPFDLLSNRELEITNLLVEGNGNLEISNALNLKKSTVSTYKNRIFEKLKITNVVSLVTLYRIHNEFN
jgi:DNA-binding NarL/FixJ family response regulator